MARLRTQAHSSLLCTRTVRLSRGCQARARLQADRPRCRCELLFPAAEALGRNPFFLQCWELTCFSFIAPQDKAQVLKDVQSIVAGQLGKDLAQVRHAATGRNSPPSCAPNPPLRCSSHSSPCSSQVVPTASLVDLGADSLDTVS